MKPVAPFAPNPGRESFFASEAVSEALVRLSDAMGDREPFLLVTGEPGCGKTALVREAIARWGEGVHAAWVSFPASTEAELVEEVVRRVGAEPPEGASVPRLVSCFEHALGEIAARGQRAVIIVDDAHAFEPATLENLRMLVNAAQRAGHRLEVLLLGLPALEARLEAPELTALRQRVSVHCRLEPLSRVDTRRYVEHRVSAAGGDGPGLFARKSHREIATQSRGLPREINAIATEALRIASAAGQTTVGADHVRAAATHLWGRALPEDDDAATEAAPTANATPEAPTASATRAAPAASAREAATTSSPPRRAVTPQTDGQDLPAPSKAGLVPPPPATRASEAPAEVGPSAPHVPSTPQDPREWVNRFMGDQGPVRIGSRAAASASWGADDSEARVEPRTPSAARHETPAAAEPSARPEASARRIAAPPSAPPHRHRRFPMALPAIAALVLVVAVVLLVRATGSSSRRRAGAAQAAGQHEPEAGPVAARGASPAPAVKTVTLDAAGADAPDGAADEGARAAGHAAPMGTTRRTLDVGSYLDADRAAAERNRLRAATGLGAWVVREPGPGGESYHVVLGIYRSDERATAAADMLLGEGRVSQARVVPLPPKRARR